MNDGDFLTLYNVQRKVEDDKGRQIGCFFLLPNGRFSTWSNAKKIGEFSSSTEALQKIRAENQKKVKSQ